MSTISIIVPVYKVRETYLRQCIESIINQTLRDLEIILIDDGSPDNCGAICDEYATNDSRIVVIHQENQGVSTARNAGLDAATGKWVMFVDADDWMDTDACERLLQKLSMQPGRAIEGRAGFSAGRGNVRICANRQDQATDEKSGDIGVEGGSRNRRNACAAHRWRQRIDLEEQKKRQEMIAPIKVLFVFQIHDENTLGGVETLIQRICLNINRSLIALDVLNVSDVPNMLLQNKLEANGGTYYILNTDCHGLIGKVKASCNLFIFLKKHSYFCVHIHSTSAYMQTMLLLAAKRAGIEWRFTHPHSCPFQREHWLKRLLRNALKKNVAWLATDYFTCSSSASKSIYPNKLIQSNKIIQINNGITPRKYVFNNTVRQQYRDALQIDAAEYVLGLIGYMSEVKNQIFAIEVLNALKYYGIKLRLLLIGRDLGEEKHVRNLVQKYRLTEQVAFLGQREDVSSLLQAMDLLIMPSISEGLGIAAIEAQAAGLHVVASDGVPTEANITGLVEYVPLSEGPQVWAKAIIKYANGYERKDMSKAITDAGFDIRETTAFLEAFYLEKAGLHLA